MNRLIFNLIICILLLPIAFAINNEVEMIVLSGDVSGPTIGLAVGGGCSPNPAYINQTVTCSAIISDVSGIQSVLANVTDPNSSIYSQNITNISSIYSFSFINTQIIGIYNVSWFAEDNLNNSDTLDDDFRVRERMEQEVLISSGGGGTIVSCPEGQSYIDGVCRDLSKGFFEDKKDDIKSFASFISADNPLLGILIFILGMFFLILAVRRVTRGVDDG